MYLRLLTFVLLISGIYTVQVEEDINILEDDKRIIHGRKAKAGEFSSTVSLIAQMWNEKLKRYTTGKYCGGSIIHENWILTAAHCIDLLNQYRDPQIIAGEVDLSKYGTVVPVDKGCKHPEYKGGKTAHDIALLRLKEPIKFNQLIQAIRLPEQNYTSSSPGYIMGWGATDGTNLGGSQAKHLMVANVPIIPAEDCLEEYRYAFGPYMGNNLQAFQKYFRNNYICVGGKGTSACGGDSGGPLIQDNLLTGVDTFSRRPCGDAPSVYTRVSVNLKWIWDSINGGDC